MKTLTSKQLDIKFAKAERLAAQLDEVLRELRQGCKTFEYGFGNSTSLLNKSSWMLETLNQERQLHKSDK